MIIQRAGVYSFILAKMTTDGTLVVRRENLALSPPTSNRKIEKKTKTSMEYLGALETPRNCKTKLGYICPVHTSWFKIRCFGS